MEKLQDAHKYQLWKNNLTKNGLHINAIEEVHTRRNGKGEVLFSLVLLDAHTPEGDKIPPICFLKGEVVMVLICFIEKETGEKYLLTVEQRRIADGNILLEHPAGMVDRDRTPREIALMEIREETGMHLNDTDLVQLGDAVYPSTGTSDECMYLFYTEIHSSREEILKFDQRTTGVEGERILTRVMPFKNAHSAMKNANCVLLNFLYLQDVQDWKLLKTLK